MISSIGYKQDEILRDIVNMHTGDIDCDVTYGRGGLYRNGEPPDLKFDLNPQRPGVIKADCRHLPLRDASVSCVMFDPPFTGGGRVRDSKIKSQYGNFHSIPDLWQFYFEAMGEFSRVVRPKGYVIFKCQDAVESGKNYFSHVQIAAHTAFWGFTPVDLFILLAKHRMPTWHMQTQRHARKFHCYFWVLKRGVTK